MIECNKHGKCHNTENIKVIYKVITSLCLTALTWLINNTKKADFLLYDDDNDIYREIKLSKKNLSFEFQ